MTESKLMRLPIGIESFSEIRSNKQYYYVDKTEMISDLVNYGGKVSLFARPRRFGKTLNMSMLKEFFDINSKPEIFNGLKILEDSEACKNYMNKFPVFFVSFKEVNAGSFENAYSILCHVIANVVSKYDFLLNSPNLSEYDREIFRNLKRVLDDCHSSSTSQATVQFSLYVLTELLNKHYGKKVIVLLDEYDVPLDKAYQNNYYDDMVEVIRGLLNPLLKTNDYLELAVLTGCLRVSKESIFTGLNNFKVYTVLDRRFSEYFGFTDDEVLAMMRYYNIEDYFDTAKKWYNGYNFGGYSVYCPWDIIEYCDKLISDTNKMPEAFWSNSSGNDLIRKFATMSDYQTKVELETLMKGGTIKKRLSKTLTYADMYSSMDSMWEILVMTGYLTFVDVDESGYTLRIPNLEVTELFVTQICEWFKDVTKEDGNRLRDICDSFINGKPEVIEDKLNDLMWNSISIRDSAVRIQYKENFYHGMLLSILNYKTEWLVESNKESGVGYCDISVRTKNKVGIVIELKYDSDNNLESQCDKALAQIEKNRYTDSLLKDGMTTILKYGIAFSNKICKVKQGVGLVKSGE